MDYSRYKPHFNLAIFNSKRGESLFRSVLAKKGKYAPSAQLLKGFTALSISFWLGSGAYEKAKQEGLKSWLAANEPKTFVVQGALAQNGLKRSSKKIEPKLYRTLPPANLYPSFWIDPQNKLIANQESQSETPVFFTFIGSSPSENSRILTPVHWKPLEPGWIGFKQVLEFVTHWRGLIKTSRDSKTRANWTDPRWVAF